MPAGGAWRTIHTELCWLRAIFFSPRLAPKIAVAAGFAYLFGPWDIIPNKTPFYGYFDETGFILAGLVAARLLVQDDGSGGTPGGTRTVGRGRSRGLSTSLDRVLRVAQSEALSAWLVNRRRVRRSRRSLPKAAGRLSSQVRRAAAASEAGPVLFRLLGYRLWWSIRSPFARSRSDHSNLVVIGGSPRSGTTLLRSMLGRHPDILSGPEATVFLHRVSSPAVVGRALDWNPDQIEDWQRRSRSQMEFIEHCTAAVLQRSGKRLWAEKTPHNVERFGFVRRRFPSAKLVHVVRDGRDVVCSLRRAPFSKVEDASWDSAAAARRCAVQWRTSVKAGLRFRGDSAYHEVRYEDLVHEPETVLRALLDFIGVPWDNAVLKTDERPARPDPHEPKAAGRIFESSIGRWQRDLSARDRAAVRILIEPLLEELDYTGRPDRTAPSADMIRPPRA